MNQPINCGGTWLPPGETHLVGWMQKMQQTGPDGRLAYQYHKLQAALARVERFRRAVDIGAHVGLWSMHLVGRFQHVEAFEPVAIHRELFGRNVQQDNYTLHAMALGEQDGSVSMKSAPTSSGDTVVAGAGDIPMRRLDDVLAGVDDVDFMKIDTEGYELMILRGGEHLLLRCKPIICVEQKPGKAQSFGLHQTGAVKYLQGLGAKVLREMSGDYLMGW